MALRATLKGDKDRQKDSCEFNALWLFKKIKTISASLNTKANLALTLHEQMLSFLMRQGATESEVKNLK